MCTKPLLLVHYCSYKQVWELHGAVFYPIKSDYFCYRSGWKPRQPVMNKYLVAIYRNDEHSLSSHLNNRRDGVSRDLDEALRVVLGDSELELTQRYRFAEMLLLGGASPNTADWDQAPLLSQAVETDDIMMLQLLLDFACDVNVTSDRGRSALHEAARHGRAGVAGVLMSSGASTNRADEDGETPLMCAVRNGDAEVIELMLIEGNVKAVNSDGETALHLAVAENSITATELLLKAHSPLDVISHANQTPLSLAVREENLALVDLLLEAGASAHIPGTSPNYTRIPVLHDAARVNYCGIIDKLVHHGAQLNALSQDLEATALQCAVQYSCTEAVCKLLQYNGNANLPCIPDAAKKKPKTLLHQALDKKDYIILKMLLLAGAKFAQEDVAGIRALLYSNMVLKSNDSWDSPEGKLFEVETFAKITVLPVSLKQMCRLIVRNHLGTCTYEKLELVDLPKALKDFVMLRELNDLI